MRVLRRLRRVRRDAPTTRASATARLLLAASPDGSCASLVRLAAALAKRDHGLIMAVTAISPVPYDAALAGPESRAAVYDESVQVAVRTVESKLRRLLGRAPWPVHGVIGWPDGALNETAASWPATMMLMGLHRHGLYDRLMLRETAIEVIRAAKIPVLAVHDSLRHVPNHLLAATAFDEASMAAALAGADILPRGGTITLAHVSAFADPANTGDLAELTRAGITARLEDAAELLHEATGRHVETTAIAGTPADALLDFARRAHCDLISLGGTDRGWVDRVLLGSVRTHVLRGARCSVLVAPPPRG